MIFSLSKFFVAFRRSVNVSLVCSPFPCDSATKVCSNLMLDNVSSVPLFLHLLFSVMKFLPLKKRIRRASKNRMVIPPKNTPNASAKMAFLLCRFLETYDVLSEPQWCTSIGPHNFGLPSKLEFGNVLSWPTVGTDPSRSLLETLNAERKFSLSSAAGIGPVRLLLDMSSTCRFVMLQIDSGIPPENLLELKLSKRSAFN
uniref:Uncharacterized protein n=1 Tax=Oryza glumipatula TaxID=40148 RepID=A0A0D9YMF4_9ORYZ